MKLDEKLPAIAPEKVRFIKLGFGGDWEHSCIQENTIRLGYESGHHKDCLNGNWNLVWRFWLDARNGNEGTATNDIRQIRDFYELKESDIWITFYKRNLYWCHTAGEVIELEDGTRIRKIIGSWSLTDKNGKSLRVENIDGRVTKVQMYKGTICSIELQEYLVRKINGLPITEVENAKISLQNLKSDVEHLIKRFGLNSLKF